MRRPSLRMRLALAGAVAVVVALVIASAALTALFASHVQRRAEAELSVHLDQIVAGLDLDPQGALVLRNPPADPRFDRPLSGLYWQIVAGDRVLRSRSLWDGALALPHDALPDGQVHVHLLPGQDRDGGLGELLTLERSVTLPARLGGGRVRVAVALATADLAQARAAFLRDLVPYDVILALALIAAGWVQLFFGLRPLARVGARVAAVRSGRETRLGADFPREVAPLAAELDALIAAREADVDHARQRAADLAHGFKTPLQALMGEADRLRRGGQAGAAQAIEEVATAMRRHVDRELARTRRAGRNPAARAGLAAVAGRVVSVVRRTPAGAALDWQVAIPGDLAAAIDAGDLTEALGALVENAARHAARAVVLEASARDGAVEIAIRDDGPGIEAARLDEMRRRGARADRAGHGLGLSIADEIAEAAGGRLVLENAAPGLRARLTLPAATGPARS